MAPGFSDHILSNKNSMPPFYQNKEDQQAQFDLIRMQLNTFDQNQPRNNSKVKKVELQSLYKSGHDNEAMFI